MLAVTSSLTRNHLLRICSSVAVLLMSKEMKIQETISEFAATLFVRFLSYVGFHHKNLLYITLSLTLKTETKVNMLQERNLCVTLSILYKPQKTIKLLLLLLLLFIHSFIYSFIYLLFVYLLA